jgi:hypothetical protein
MAVKLGTTEIQPLFMVFESVSCNLLCRILEYVGFHRTSLIGGLALVSIRKVDHPARFPTRPDAALFKEKLFGSAPCKSATGTANEVVSRSSAEIMFQGSAH